MPNPFSLSIAQGAHFCNREKEIQDLVRHARSGNNVLLFSPRRYGKTSLVKRTLDLLAGEGFLTIYVDLFPIISERDMVSRLSSALFKGVGRGLNQQTLAARLKDLFKRLIPIIEVKPDGYSVSANGSKGPGPGVDRPSLFTGISGAAPAHRWGHPACRPRAHFHGPCGKGTGARVPTDGPCHERMDRPVGTGTLIGDRRVSGAAPGGKGDASGTVRNQTYEAAQVRVNRVSFPMSEMVTVNGLGSCGPMITRDPDLQ